MVTSSPGKTGIAFSPADLLTGEVTKVRDLNIDRSAVVVQTDCSHFNHQTMQHVNDHMPNDTPFSRSQTFPYTLSKVSSNISSRRGLDFSLPRFEEVSVPVPALLNETDDRITQACDRSPLSRLLMAASTPCMVRPGSQGPPTPPNEAEFLPWISEASTEPRQAGSADRSQGSTPSEPTGTLASVPQYFMPQNNNVMPQAGELSSEGLTASPWLYHALRVASAPLEVQAPTTSAKVISQVLPPNTADRRQVKTYEVFCDHLQRILPEPQYVSITHALTVSAGQVVEDFPKSPPVTPSFSSGDSYFGDQTVFTHAAQVPMYHEYKTQDLNIVAAQPQRHIMIAEANIVILERCIPPTTAEETIDFFDANSCRSYLTDRLPELAADVGSLVLVYPTKTGGKTFAQRYLGPVLDPILREITVLKGLNTGAAEALGSLNGLESMYEFDEMQSRVQDLCASMNARLTMQKSRTEFLLTHSESAQITLDRKTWTTWFIEQEQTRLKQNLVEYHRDGGRLPGDARSNTELTVGMLTREITEGLRKSTATAGGAGIEVGIFVIRRHKRPAAP